MTGKDEVLNPIGALADDLVERFAASHSIIYLAGFLGVCLLG
jgi:hypothetical protein